jgi:hypothetical protein
VKARSCSFDPFNFRPSWFSWTLLMAYSKVKLKSNGFYNLYTFCFLVKRSSTRSGSCRYLVALVREILATHIFWGPALQLSRGLWTNELTNLRLRLSACLAWLWSRHILLQAFEACQEIYLTLSDCDDNIRKAGFREK